MAVFAASQHPNGDTFKMNQLCKVCGEPAAGFHFGAFTCEGCKSFFGRSYNNLSVISECKNGGQCVINKKNRTSCKACRLRKCLLVGMSKSGSRYGRRSNWFKLHCLMQDQTTATSNSHGSESLHLRSSRGFHSPPGLMGAISSSMSSNESKEDAEEYKTSTSPSISSPGSQHSDSSSVDLAESKPPSIGHLNPFALKLAAHPSLCGGFTSMGLPLIGPHLQAAAGFFPANLVSQPRFLFPAGLTLALPGSSLRVPGAVRSSSSSKKFNIDSMLPPAKASPEAAAVAAEEAEQDTPMDLSVKRFCTGLTHNKNHHQQQWTSDESDEDDTTCPSLLHQDFPGHDDSSQADDAEQISAARDPLDLTRK